MNFIIIFSKRFTLFFSLGLILGLGACTQNPPEVKPSVPVRVLVLDSLAHPWSIAFVDKDNAFISEKDGGLLKVNLKTKERKQLKGIPADLFTPFVIEVDKHPPRTYPFSVDGKAIRGNCGLLDVVLHPDFKSNAQIYLSYVSRKENTLALKVISAQVVNDSLTDVKTILNPGPYVPGHWHFGGGMCILEKHLYITVGERLFFEDLKQGLAIAQDVSDARGAIYRLNLDGSIPANNPKLGDDAVPGIYAFGIRAAQGITVRPGTNDIWFSEHGTNQGDELNKLIAGANYGWPNKTTGTWRSPGYKPSELDNPNYTNPIHFWKQTVAPTGLTFYTGSEFPQWHGNLIVPGLSGGSLWRMVLDGDVVVSAEELFLNSHVRSRKVAQGPDGHLYQLTDEDNGRLLRIEGGNKNQN